jgi:hypothetical protein
VWAGVGPLLAPKADIVVRIGGQMSREELARGLKATLTEGLHSRKVMLRSSPTTSEVRGRQTNIFRPGASPSVEHDFVFFIK